jgi:hypothetical protein
MQSSFCLWLAWDKRLCCCCCCWLGPEWITLATAKQLATKPNLEAAFEATLPLASPHSAPLLRGGTSTAPCTVVPDSELTPCSLQIEKQSRWRQFPKSACCSLMVSSTPVVDEALPTVSPLVPLRSVLLA